jgi:hypothetical protein
MKYRVNSYDICCPGMERLRSNSEFILVTTVYKGVLGEEIRDDMKQQIQSCAQPDGFDYEACRQAIDDFIDQNIAGNCARLFGDIDPPSDNEEGVNLYVFMTGPGFEDGKGY